MSTIDFKTVNVLIFQLCVIILQINVSFLWGVKGHNNAALCFILVCACLTV